jgi:hypothetical protein
VEWILQIPQGLRLFFILLVDAQGQY